MLRPDSLWLSLSIRVRRWAGSPCELVHQQLSSRRRSQQTRIRTSHHPHCPAPVPICSSSRHEANHTPGGRCCASRSLVRGSSSRPLASICSHRTAPHCWRVSIVPTSPVTAHGADNSTRLRVAISFKQSAATTKSDRCPIPNTSQSNQHDSRSRMRQLLVELLELRSINEVGVAEKWHSGGWQWRRGRWYGSSG